MHSIKYRAWDNIKGLMYEDVWVVDKFLILEYTTGGFDGLELSITKYDLVGDKEDGFSDYKLMRYTGLKDSHLRELYEKDIVRIYNDREGIDYLAVIEYMDGGFCAINGTLEDYSLRRYDLSRHDLDLVVVGNYYENKGLLK